VRRRLILAAAALAIAVAAGPRARAEPSEIRVAKGFGMIYLAMIVVEEQKLLEKHLERAGLSGVKVSWSSFSGGTAMNDALISGNVDFANGGTVPMIVFWAKSRRNLDVRAVAAISATPQYLNSRNPKVKSVRDFTQEDRIAVPAIRTSSQALTLQMAAEQAFGPGEFRRLDPLTVAMSPPDGHAAMMTGRTEITAVFTTPPFMYEQLRDPRIHRVLSSFDVLGGPATGVVAYTTNQFREKNPKSYGAFYHALEEAIRVINDDKRQAAELYVRNQSSKESVDSLVEILSQPESVFTTTPQNTMKYAEFMHRVGVIPEKPDSWKDLFFPEVHGLPGS
jgi:NitT/TauT family transport system substrate-binding protein